jgi:hypothetical protein
LLPFKLWVSPSPVCSPPSMSIWPGSKIGQGLLDGNEG